MPSVRYWNERSAMAFDGNCAIITETSRTMVHSRQECSNRSTWNEPSGLRYGSKLTDARLHAVSSRNMYSEQGFEATIGPASGLVCHSLMVVWKWMPGSAEAHAA